MNVPGFVDPADARIHVPGPEEGGMQTSLRIDGANCPSCFHETLDDLAQLDGVRAVHGSIAGPCIEVDHDDVALEVITETILDRLHGIEMFSNEAQMVSVELVEISTPCPHHRDVEPEAATPMDFRGSGIDPSMTLGEIVSLHPSVASVLEARGLDYCCHGGRTLAAAAGEAGLAPEVVAGELSAARVDEPAAAWVSLGPADLVGHIESVHHRYLRLELPRVGALVDKIVAVHGERHPELAEVQRLYTDLRADLEPHLAREEQVLFPMIRQLAAHEGRTRPDTEELAEQISELVAEHETVGELLVQLRGVTCGYATPADGCATFDACYRALAELEADTHLHVHKESNVLFPTILGERVAGGRRWPAWRGTSSVRDGRRHTG